MKQKTKVFNIVAVSVCIVTAVIFLYPYANNFNMQVRDSEQNATTYYAYTAPNITSVDTSNMPPAVAVPILMYHGVTYKFTSENTTVKTFIEQMEMLKREGYQTISMDEFDRFRQGTFVLPPKPIIITFDDGRKDSYYTTDRVLEQLGFKATLFYASAPVIDGNTFYLDWDELKVLQRSGRWEIEAHGRNAHKRIPTDNTGELKDGRFLISKMYLTDLGRIETDSEFAVRLERDYIESIEDLKNHLGITSRYFAIPLNDYGNLLETNFKGASSVNIALMKKYFKLAFIQVNSPEDVVDIKLSVYNFATGNPYAVGRIEVKEMSADSLKLILEREYPSEPRLLLENSNFLDGHSAHSLIGNEAVFKSGYVLTSEGVGESAMALFGQRQWENYLVRAEYKKLAGDSVSLVAPYKDNKNYVTCGVNNGEVFARHFTAGNVESLAKTKRFVLPEGEADSIEMKIEGMTASCSINGTLVFKNIPLPFSEGAVGVKVTGDEVPGSVLVNTLSVTPLK